MKNPPRLMPNAILPTAPNPSVLGVPLEVAVAWIGVAAGVGFNLTVCVAVSVDMCTHPRELQ